MKVHTHLAVTLAALTTLAAAQDTPRPARRDPLPRVRYELGPDSLPQPGVPKGRLEGPHLFQSKIIENTVRKYWVYVPSQYDPAKPACVLVFQDGARATNPTGVLRVPQVLENLIAKGEIPVTIGIFITPGQRGTDFPDSIGTGNPDNRDREYDVLDDKYARMIIEEILPEVGKSYNLTNDPAGRAIGGSSSGGICAFTVAWHRPDQFRNVISLIGSFTNIHGGHVYPDLVRQADHKPIRIFLQDGVNDNRSPNDLDRDWHIQNQKMVAALSDKGYDMAHVFGAGAHSDDHGGAILPDMLRWIWRDYPGVKAPATDPVQSAQAFKPTTLDPFPGFDASANVDPTGTWKWRNQFGRAQVENTLKLTKSQDGLTGTCEIRQGDSAPESIPLQAVELHGNKLTFDLTRQINDRTITLTYQGIINGDRLTGWSMSDFGGTPRDREWQATRAAEPRQ